MGLDRLRKKINMIDSEILTLLNERLEVTLSTKKFKKEITDVEREKEVLEQIRKNSKGLVAPEFSEKVFSQIMNESKKIQEKNMKLIGFQGEHGAYGEIAARKFYPESAYLPFKGFSEVFEEVSSGNLDAGVVPVQNSVGGAVAEVSDLLIESNLKVIAEINLPIHHCLLTLPETDYREIKVAYSHPQALSQCRLFLQRNKIEPRDYYDTAGAAKMLSAEKPKAAAAIASKLAAKQYNLEIIKENIEDHQLNITRFLVLARETSEENGDKCSTVFSTKHKAGALFNVLRLFADAKINLTRIESRPIKENPGEYAFFLDFKGSDKDNEVVKVIENVKKETTMFKFLGCYKGVE